MRYCETVPELLDLAREAMAKAKLFGGSAWSDFQQQDTEQKAQAQDPIGLIIQKMSAAPTGGSVGPSLEQSISSGLGAIGLPGGQNMGFFKQDTPVGDISIGPRELAGLVIGGLATPGGPGGKAEGVAAKASENISKSIMSRMGAGAARLAAKSAGRKAEGVVEKAAPKVEQTVVQELKPGERFVTGGTPESMVENLFGPKVGLPAEVTAEQAPATVAHAPGRPPTQGPSLEATIASRDAPPPRVQTPDPREQLAPSSQFNQDPNAVEAQKQALAKAKYESGLEDVPVEFDEAGNPTLPEGMSAPDLTDVPEGPLLKAGKGGSSSTRMTTAQRDDLGPTKQAADVAGLQEWEQMIGEPRTGNKKATGLERDLDTRRTEARAQQFLDDQAAQFGDKTLTSHAFRDWLTKFIYGSESKRGPGGDVIWKIDPKTKQPLEIEGVKQPLTVFRPLWRRVQEADQDEANGVITKDNRLAHGWITHQSPKPGVRKPYTLDTREGPKWHETPGGRQWLAHEALAIASEPGGQFAGKTPSQIADSLINRQANEMAGEATSIKTSRSDVKPAKFGTSDEPEGLSSEDTGRAFGTGDTAHVTQNELEDSGMSRMDPRKPMEREVDQRSTDPLANQGYEFPDDETRSRFFELKDQKDSAEKLIAEHAAPDTAKKIGVSQAEVDKRVAEAHALVDDADTEMAQILDVSSVADDAERTGMDQPQKFDNILIDPRSVIRMREPRPLPEGVSATVHYSDPVTGRGMGLPLADRQGPSTVNPSKTFTGEMPSTGMVTGTSAERERQIQDKSVEYVQKQLSFLQDSGAFKGLSGDDKIKLIQQHVGQARRRAELAVNAETGVEKKIRNPEAYTQAGDALREDMAAKARGEAGLSADEIAAHRKTMVEQGLDSPNYDYQVPRNSDPVKRLQAIRKDIATNGGKSKLVQSQQATGRRSLRGAGTGSADEPLRSPHPSSEAPLPLTAEEEAMAAEDAAKAPAERGQRPAAPSKFNPFSSQDLDQFVSEYLKTVGTDASPAPLRRAGPPQRATRAPTDPILELLSQQRRAGPQGSATQMRPNINLQEMLRRIGLAA